MTTTESGGAASARLEACLDAVETWQPLTKGFVTVTADAARRETEAADRAARDGKWLGMLHGMVVAVKDNIDTAGVKTTAGSLFFRDHVPNSDAPTVTRLKNAGAVIVGKATMHEFAFGVRSFNPVIGQSRNPYDLERIPGGSSGGSGIVVAAGMCEAALGTDTGGSVRIPAAMNGIAGLRPTLGRISNRGCFPVSAQHDTIGPMARTVADCARLFAVLAGYDPEDPVSENRPLENFLPSLGSGIAGLKIGVPRNHYLEGLSADTASAFQSALAMLEKCGARLVDVRVPGAETAHDHASVMVYSDACLVHADRLDGPEENWGRMTIERMRTGLKFTSLDYARAVHAKQSLKQAFARVFDEVDCMVSPTTPEDPALIEDGRSLLQATAAATRTTYVGAFGELPGLSVPCGVSKAGMPIGLQIESRWWDEPLLLRAGHAYEQATDWHRLRPKAPASKGPAR